MNLMDEVDSVEAKTAVTKTLSVLSEAVGLRVSLDACLSRLPFVIKQSNPLIQIAGPIPERGLTVDSKTLLVCLPLFLLILWRQDCIHR